ncbi:hypothetical protein [Bradyrhizobium sp. URHC0002]
MTEAREMGRSYMKAAGAAAATIADHNRKSMQLSGARQSNCLQSSSHGETMLVQLKKGCVGNELDCSLNIME